MNDFQIYNKKYSKLSLHKNDPSKVKMKNIPQGLKNILITNSNGLEISSLYGNYYHNSKKNIMEDNYNYRQITYNNSNNKNLSFPINTTSSNKNIISKYKDTTINNPKNNLFKKKFDKFLNDKKIENSSNYNSKENTNNNINILSNNMNGIILNKPNLKINIIPKKSNFKFINIKDNISLNLNKNGKSVSKSKSKSKSKSRNQRENKSYNNKINNNINKMIFDKYLKLYKIGERGFLKKAKSKNINYINKESPNFNYNKNANDINPNNSDLHKMSSLNMITNIQYRGLKKKNKSSNFLINNNKPKNLHISKTNSNIIITNIESNNKNIINKANNKSDNNCNLNNNKSDKKYLTENHIMYIMNKKNSEMKKQKAKYNKDKEKHISLKDIKNDSNAISNANNNSNNFIHNYLGKKHSEENQDNIIYDYKNNKILTKNNKNKENNNNLNIFNDINKKYFLNINNERENSEKIPKVLNERLKTEYNDNSLEAIDKMYEEENTEEINQKSLSFSKHDSFRFLYPEIYIRDDEHYYENKNNFSGDKKEKELDETESPLKMDTEKLSIENSGVLSFDQVKDIICYNNMNNVDKKNDFLFKKNERQIYDINYKAKYLNFFFGNNNKEKNIGLNTNINTNTNNNSNNNEIIDDIISFKTNANFKYPSSSIFSIDTEYSSKMKKKYNKNLVKNI